MHNSAVDSNEQQVEFEDVDLLEPALHLFRWQISKFDRELGAQRVDLLQGAAVCRTLSDELEKKVDDFVVQLFAGT